MTKLLLIVLLLFYKATRAIVPRFNLLEAKNPEVQHMSVRKQDFKPYLEAVIVASQRARSILYILVIALIAIFAAYRNTAHPAWLDLRLQQFQMAYNCMQNGITTTECINAVNYTKGFMYQSPTDLPVSKSSEKYKIETDFLKGPSYLCNQSEERRELLYQIDMLMKQRTENLSISFPILGVVMDMNDLGWISGITLLSLLYILLLALTREEDNLNRAKLRAEQSGDKGNLELLLMAPIFSAPPKAKTGASKVFYLFFAVPSVLHFLIIYTDIFIPKSREVGLVLLGPVLFWLQMILELAFFLGIIWLSLYNALKWKHIASALNRIRLAYEKWDN